MTIRVVCFDLGGVVVRIHRTWEQAARDAGVFRGHAPSWRAERTVQAWRQLDLDYHRGQVSSADYFTRVSSLSDGFYSAADCQHVHERVLIGEYPGLPQLVGALRSMGVATACLSNTNEGHWQQMSEMIDGAVRFPTLASLDTCLASHKLQLLKPEAALFERALSEFGVEAAEVVFFDDLAENVAGAQACGWNARVIDPDGDPQLQLRRALAEFGLKLTQARAETAK